MRQTRYLINSMMQIWTFILSVILTRPAVNSNQLMNMPISRFILNIFSTFSTSNERVVWSDASPSENSLARNGWPLVEKIIIRPFDAYHRDE